MACENLLGRVVIVEGHEKIDRDRKVPMDRDTKKRNALSNIREP